MAAEENWWAKDRVVAKPNQVQQVDGGVYVPPTPEKPEKPREAPSGYRYSDGGNLEIIPGGPADPSAKKSGAADLTVDQGKAIDFYQRARSSQIELERLNLAPDDIIALATQDVLPPNLANRFSDTDRRLYRSAAKNFAMATLRRESGAAITPEEITTQISIFFPGAGADERERQTLKRQRDLTILGLGSAAGPYGLEQANKNLQSLGFIDEQGNPIIDTAETAGGVPVLKVAEGDRFSTDEDIAIASELQGMWAAGKTLDEVNAKAIELTGGNPLSAETIKALSEDPQRTIRFTPNRSGIREPSAPGMGTAAGAAAIRGYTSNLGEEILSGFSPEAAAKLQAAGEYGMENYPITSMLAEIPSSIVSPINKLTKFLPGGPVVRDIVEGGIYGGGEGRPDASALERAKTAAAGGILQSGFGAAARRFMPGGATPEGAGIPEGEFVNVTGEVPAGMAPEMPMGAAPAPSVAPAGAPAGMAPPTAGMAPPIAGEAVEGVAAEIGRDEITAIARKAVSRGPGASKARAELAELAKIDPEAQAAADRLGIELPVDVLGQNAQLQRLTGLDRAQIGSDVETAWRKTYDAAAERAYTVMDELEAVKDISGLSKNVFDKLETANKGLEVQADDLRKQVNGAIDVSGRVDASAIRSYLEDQIRKLGGGTEGLKELSKEEKKLWAMVSKGNPTYEALDKKRAEIGRAMTKNSGPWVDSNAQRINDIYAKLADDQMGFIESSAGKEIADKQRAANTLFKQMYDGRGQMQEIFGRNLSKDLGPLITTAITQGGKGGVEAINKLLTNIPENMRGTVLTSGLFSTATGANGRFSFTNFANTYSKLREQSQVFNQFAKAIGPEGVNLLNDFNAISRRIADAEANISKTGASTQLNALNAENLLLKIVKGLGSAGAAAGAANVMGADLLMTAGTVIAAAGGPALAQKFVGKTNAEKLHGLMKSDKFRELAVSAATGEGVDRNINRVAGSKEFRDYAKLVGIDMKDAGDWLNSAISKGATIAGTEAIGSKPDEAPTVEMPQ